MYPSLLYTSFVTVSLSLYDRYQSLAFLYARNARKPVMEIAPLNRFTFYTSLSFHSVSVYQKSGGSSTDLFIRNSFILCLVHLLLQTGAVYLFCFLKWTSARVLILHIILLVLTLVVLALLYMSTREIRRQFRETSNGFVSQAKEKLKAVQASPYGTAARDICSQIGYALDGSPQLSGKSSLTIEKNILTVLDNAARASDETQCINELKQVVPLLSQRSSVL